MADNNKDKQVEENIRPLFFNLDKEIDISSIKKNKKDKKKKNEQLPIEAKEETDTISIESDVNIDNTNNEDEIFNSQDIDEINNDNVKPIENKKEEVSISQNENISVLQDEEDSIFTIRDDIEDETYPETEDEKEEAINLDNNETEDVENNKEKTSKIQTPNNKKILMIAGIIGLSIVLLFSMVFITKLIIKDNNKPTETQTEVVENNDNKKAEDIVIERVKEIVNKANEKTKVINLPTTSVDGEQKDTYFTYTNDYYGISFKYPSNWIENYQFQLKKTDNNVKNIVLLTQPPEEENLDNMRITIEYTKKSITAKEYIRQTEEKMKQIFPELTIVNTGEITVSGREAPTRVYIWVPEEELEKSDFPQEWKRIQQYQVYVAGNNKMYIVTFTGTVDTFSKNYEKYEQILETLELGD